MAVVTIPVAIVPVIVAAIAAMRWAVMAAGPIVTGPVIAADMVGVSAPAMVRTVWPIGSVICAAAVFALRWTRAIARHRCRGAMADLPAILRMGIAETGE